MTIINILTDDFYDPDKHYIHLNSWESIRRAFDYAVNHRDGEPAAFTDEDSNKLFEYLSSIEPYLSEGFKRTGDYTIYTNDMGTDLLTNLHPSIMLVLLLLSLRDSKSVIIIEPMEFTGSPEMSWLMNNYDIEVSVYIEQLYNSGNYLWLERDYDVEYRHNGEKLENVFQWVEEQLRFTKKLAQRSFERLTDRQICINTDRPLTYAQLCDTLDRHERAYYDSLKLGIPALDIPLDSTNVFDQYQRPSDDPLFGDYTVDIPSGVWITPISSNYDHPSVFCVIDCGGASRFVQCYPVRYPTLADMLKHLLDIFAKENAQRLTAIVSQYRTVYIYTDYAKYIEYGVMLDRNSSTITLLYPQAAAVRFHEALQAADIPEDAYPEDYETSYD